jgi:thiamine-monophosphate kinase
VRIEIDLEALPLAPGVAGVAAALGVAPYELAAAGGEDYELCACLDPAAASTAGLLVVGRVDAGEPGVTLRDASGPRLLAGFEHAVG